MKAKKTFKLTRLAAVFATGQFIATAIRMVSGILVTKLVSPATLGLYNGIGLVRGYAPFLHLGLPNGLNRDLPYYLGKKDEKKARELASTLFGWMLAVSVLSSLLLLGVSGYHLFRGNGKLAFGWFSYIIPVLGIFLGQFYLRILYATHSRFERLSFILVLTAFTSLVALVFVWQFDFYGLCIRGIITGLAIIGLLWKWRPLNVRPSFQWDAWRELFSTGMPIFLVGQLYAFWPTLDQTLVLKYTGTEGLGLYALATLAGPTVLLFIQSLTQVVYPSMSQAYGESDAFAPLIRLAIGPTLITFFMTAFIIVLAWFAIPPAVRWFLPKYAGGIRAAQWSVVATIALTFQPLNNFFIVTKRLVRYGGAILVGMGSYVVALHFLLKSGVALEKFPQALLIGRIIFILMCAALIVHMTFSKEEKMV